MKHVLAKNCNWCTISPSSQTHLKDHIQYNDNTWSIGGVEDFQSSSFPYHVFSGKPEFEPTTLSGELV